MAFRYGKIYEYSLFVCLFLHIKVDLPPPVHFSKCTTRFPYKTYGVRKRNLGKSSINRQIQKYVANHNKDGPKTKLKMKKFLTALSSVLYFMVYFPPYVLYVPPLSRARVSLSLHEMLAVVSIFRK